MRENDETSGGIDNGCAARFSRRPLKEGMTSFLSGGREMTSRAITMKPFGCMPLLTPN
jgi:hypothetical protein